MPCYNPLRAWKGDLLPSGKREILFKEPKGRASSALEFPLKCGQCIGCRLDRSADWAMRCVHEASLYKENCFITLTYDEVCVPEDGGLVKEHFQLFMKRLRKKYGEGVRFYACGEYGEESRRPHYHACLFNHNFIDRKPHSVNGHGNTMYTSDELGKLWTYGFSMIGDVTFDSAAYVARYVMKKVTGKEADEHYVDKETGYIMPSEFTLMSRGGRKKGPGGIGKGWFDKYKSDCFPSDYLIMKNGGKRIPPRYYTNQLELTDPDMYAKIKEQRRKRAASANADNSLARLYVKEECKRDQIKNLKRSLD